MSAKGVLNMKWGVYLDWNCLLGAVLAPLMVWVLAAGGISAAVAWRIVLLVGGLPVLCVLPKVRCCDEGEGSCDEGLDPCCCHQR